MFHALPLITLALIAGSVVVNGRPPRFPSMQGKEVLQAVRAHRSKY
jgi:hypothetical protein